MTAVKTRDIIESFSGNFPLLQKVYSVYEKSPLISQDQENTLRKSIESTTLEILELIVVASRQFSEGKKETLIQAMRKIDTLKVFVDMAIKTSYVDGKHGEEFQESVNGVGAMVGGWLKAVNTKKEKED